MSKHQLRAVSVVSLIAFVFAVTPAVRAEKPASQKAAKAKPDKPRSFTGVVDAVDATAATCTLTRKTKGKEGKEVVETKTFKCAADCKFMGDEKKGLADFKVGDKITVMFTGAAEPLTCVKMFPTKPKKEGGAVEKEKKKKTE